MFQCTPVFHANYTSKAKVNVNQGGTASSKTYSLMQLLFLKAINEKGVVITVTGESIPNLKKGAYRDAETLHAKTPELKHYISFWNKTDRIIYFKNGSLIEFVSNLDQQSAKNGKRDYLFVNEANGIDYLIYWQLAIRTRKQIFIDYNPSAPFWVHDNLIGHEGVQLIISDHRHNPFLSAEEHQKIEGIKDPELWRVYARGMTGNLMGLIHPTWTMIPDAQYPWKEPSVSGLDFGYTNDPTAGVKVVRMGDSLFLHEMCYTPDISIPHLKQIYIANGFDLDNDPVYCEHDPDMISPMRRTGFRLAKSARKGPGSILAGINRLKDFKVFYTASSTNLHEEKKRYMWETDEITGKPINKPIDVWNHLMDAIRYAVYSHWPAN